MSKYSVNNFGLTERDMQTIQDIFIKYAEVDIVHIFGSRATGNYKKGSDIDLALMNIGVSDKTTAKIQSDFEESSLPFSVDIINFPSVENPDIIDHINRVGIIIYKKSEKQVRLEVI